MSVPPHIYLRDARGERPLTAVTRVEVGDSDGFELLLRASPDAPMQGAVFINLFEGGRYRELAWTVDLSRSRRVDPDGHSFEAAYLWVPAAYRGHGHAARLLTAFHDFILPAYPYAAGISALALSQVAFRTLNAAFGKVTRAYATTLNAVGDPNGYERLTPPMHTVIESRLDPVPLESAKRWSPDGTRHYGAQLLNRRAVLLWWGRR